MELPQHASELHAFWQGGWRFTRKMQNLDGTPIGSAEGVAEFQSMAEGSGLHYHEAGKLQLLADTRTISFSRRFDYHCADDLWHVVFADGPQAGQAYQSYRYDALEHVLLPVATHVCLQDHYDGSYRFPDTGQFSLQTRIEGPHKDYLLLSHFSRGATI